MNETHNISMEVMSIGSAVRVIPTLIPNMEKQLLCATFLEAVIRFYQDPDNAKAFERWRNEKGGSANGSERSGKTTQTVP